MRTALSVVFSILILALVICVLSAMRSKRSIGKNVANLLVGLTIPIFGNLIIIITSDQIIANVGYDVYFLGMDVSVVALLFFAHAYCDMGKVKRGVQTAIYIAGGIDVLQYAVNSYIPITFKTEMITVDERAYYRLVPLFGQLYHRLFCYGLFLATFVIFIVVTIKASRVYVEKYMIILISLSVMMAVETYYIISRHPLDMSMIGLGILGLLVYFFALHYRSMRVLDGILASMASDMPDALFFFDKSGRCIWTNEPGRKRIGVKEGHYENVKANLKFLFDDIDFSYSEWSKKVVIGVGDDAQYMDLTMRSAQDELGRTTGSYLSVRDNTADYRAMQRDIYNATHDSVTGLYAKEYLYEQIARRLANDTKTHYMIGFIEISNFKMINDVFGRKFGKFTVKKIAEVLKASSSNKTLYGRLGDDSFGILIDKERFDEKKVEQLIETFVVSDGTLDHHVLLHFGIYDINTEMDVDVPLFFDSARLATTKITDNYSRRIAYYDDQLRSEAIHDQLISNQLEEAIETKQIRPYLQPIVDSRGMLAGAEALVRWIHPVEGFMNPGQFIPIFEKNGQISEVDKYMWRCACELLADWKKRSIDNFISVNVSPKDFYRLDVVSEFKSLVEEFGIDPVKLRIEITETAMTNDSVDMLKTISDLREYGFIVEMDDFGSGYSSLNLLKDINLDLIKIDMQFLKDSERNMKASLIIKNIINMSEDLGIDTLTEGVETAKQFEKLYDMGCRLYQGYYFSKPVPVEDFEKQWFD